jgi:hypothetical protein
MPTCSLTLAVALLLPALALAAPQPSAAADDDPARQAERMRRLRLTRIVGLAEALDLDEAGALKLRETLAKSDEKRAPLLRQVHDSVRVLRAASRDEAGAAGQVDGAVQRLLEARAKLAQLDRELLAQVTQGATAARKARAVLFLARYARRAQAAAFAPARTYARPPYGPPSYTPPGAPPPAGPPQEIEPRNAPPGAPAPGSSGPQAEDWFSDTP